MTIEFSPPSPPDPAPQRTPAAAGAGKPSSGFSSVLQGLGDPVAQAATRASAPSAQAVDPATGSDPGAANGNTASGARSQHTGKTASAAATEEPAAGTACKTSDGLADAPAAAPAAPQGSVADSAAQALLAQFLGMAGAHGIANSGANVDTASSPDVSRLRQAATAGFLPAAGVASGAASAAATSGLNLPDTAGDPGLGANLALGAGKRWLPGASAQPQLPWQSTVASVGAAQDAAAKLASARGALSDASAQPLTFLAQTAPDAALVSAMADPDQGNINGRRRGAAALEPTRLDAPTPTGMAAAPSAPNTGGVASNGASASGQVLEQAVAEQVKYWISNDVHNAQLKFDGLGPQSVQVNISMSGNQAQVVFQSDQAHTRELLSNAMAQLDQMLRGEGLTLTSAWVGSSGQQGQFGSSAQQAQPGPHRMPLAASLTVDPSSAAARPSASSNRALDLFV